MSDLTGQELLSIEEQRELFGDEQADKFRAAILENKARRASDANFARWFWGIALVVVIALASVCNSEPQRNRSYEANPLSDPELQRDPSDRYRGY